MKCSLSEEALLRIKKVAQENAEYKPYISQCKNSFVQDDEVFCRVGALITSWDFDKEQLKNDMVYPMSPCPVEGKPEVLSVDEVKGTDNRFCGSYRT